ncbi:uncharacterized protein PV09_00740 [Verruconis gallopava]|uniref:BTB domain-containing protein n=1 Tax=Verruconis gallopava TaxID=253628 RepID=A0A0D1Y154_9PEZI|nr:uncharacterized protein PV09_00740 [Verruconis gallopava]KIW08806.1 hypothetical protein PV09_00740 [Verruconis gallopava]
MFRSNSTRNPSFSKRVDKSSKKQRSSFQTPSKSRRLEHAASAMESVVHTSPAQQTSPSLTSPIVTICVGREQRLFAAHEDVLSHSHYLSALCRAQFYESPKRIDLPEEEPEIFSCVLEYLYKGDYYPRLEYDKRRQSWQLEDGTSPDRQSSVESTVFLNGHGVQVLKDTAVYCLAEKFGLAELQRLALRKQGLQSGIQCSTILTSARYAYANTPEHDSKLRAHYLALIIRSRHTFKRSGTMQQEMEQGGKLFFDLFVAMTNHMDDLVKSPRH